MAVRIWYRGEGVGVAPATFQGVSHDLKDGVYYADELRVANVYAAERAPTPADRRVYQVSVEMDQMKVLDLTTHPEWKKIMDFKMSDGRTMETMLKQQPSAQQYEAMFDGFLKNTKLNYNDFDAIIGPEFRNGGKQICILHKAGQPSRLANMLKAARVPVSSTPVTATPKGRLAFAGKIGPGLRAVKGVVGGAIASIGLAILGSLFKRKFDQMVLDMEMKKIAGLIDAQARAKTLQIVDILANNKKAFVNITIDRIVTNSIDFHTIPMGGPAATEDLSLKLNDVDVSATDIQTPERFVDDATVIQSYATQMTYRSTYSVEVTMTKEEIDLYNAYKKEILWYEKALETAPSPEDAKRLSADKVAMESQMRAAFE